MAQRPFSLLLIRRITLTTLQNYSKTLLPLPHFTKYSTSSHDPQKPTSLSSRMSFVFDQIDAIERERERSQKDQTLQRIRAWRQSKDTQNQETQNPPLEIHKDEDLRVGSGGNVHIGLNPELGCSQDENFSRGSDESHDPEPSLGEIGLEETERKSKKKKGMVELVHPWPEWIELMERLVQQNYFDHVRSKVEDKMIEELGLEIDGDEEGEDIGVDFSKDFKTVLTACLNFGKDRFDILRSLSRQDIQILVGNGCPSADKKVVFSSKLLRKRVHLDEGDVCSNCSLRNSCDRAFLLTNKEDEARTIDIMRVLSTYGFDPINGSVVNKSILKQKPLKTVVRKLLHEVVKLSGVPIDPNLPPPVIKKPPPKVKQPPPPPKKRVGRDDVEMKKGDWLCPKCDFMNFAKNTVCLQCDAKRPKRQLLPGEWECPGCNFLNYRRNMTCYHCDCKRPPDEYTENKVDQRHQPRNHVRGEKNLSNSEVSNAWNFNFDDDESDGADVAAFEYADSGAMSKDTELNSGGNERESFDHINRRPGMGFDDFDDEEDDNVDSYELDTTSHNNSSPVCRGDAMSDPRISQRDDFENGGFDNTSRTGQRMRSSSYTTSMKPVHSRRPVLSGSDSDDDISTHPKWKSSHVSDSRQNDRVNGRYSRRMDEELDLDSDDDFGSKRGGGGGGFRKKERFKSAYDSGDLSFSGSSRSWGRGSGSYDFVGDRRGQRSTSGRRISWDDDYDDRRSRTKSFNGPRRDGHSRNNHRGQSREYDNVEHGEFKNSRRVIER